MWDGCLISIYSKDVPYTLNSPNILWIGRFIFQLRPEMLNVNIYGAAVSVKI